VANLRSENAAFRSQLTEAQEQLAVTKADFTRFADAAAETQGNYQRELTQHGKTMEQLLALKEEVRVLQYCYH